MIQIVIKVATIVKKLVRVVLAKRYLISSLPYFSKWLILSGLIGVISGLGSVAFYAALRFSMFVFLKLIAAYQPPSPAGEGNFPGSPGFVDPLAIVVSVGLGALIAGYLIYTFAPEAEGHGSDEAIKAVHQNPKGIKPISIVVKVIASALTIGSGGSGGREGPTALISAGFASVIARWLGLSDHDAKIAVAVGIGSGIGSIFRAPFGGALLAGDILYRKDFYFEPVLPGLIASVIGYSIFGAFFGYRPIFELSRSYTFTPYDLLWFSLLGVVCAIIGILYAKAFYGAITLSKLWPFDKRLRPAVGGVLVGVIAIIGFPQVLATGYGWVQKALYSGLSAEPLYIVLLLPFARIVATSFSIGSGGSGGVFAPGIDIGAFTGLAFWRILSVLHVTAIPSGIFVAVGMMTTFGAISRAPIAVSIMVAEMISSIYIIIPALLSLGVALLIVSNFDVTIYKAQLDTQAIAPQKVSLL